MLRLLFHCYFKCELQDTGIVWALKQIKKYKSHATDLLPYVRF